MNNISLRLDNINNNTKEGSDENKKEGLDWNTKEGIKSIFDWKFNALSLRKKGNFYQKPNF